MDGEGPVGKMPGRATRLGGHISELLFFWAVIVLSFSASAHASGDLGAYECPCLPSSSPRFIGVPAAAGDQLWGTSFTCILAKRATQPGTSPSATCGPASGHESCACPSAAFAVSRSASDERAQHLLIVS
jgi:hypothetical protein